MTHRIFTHLVRLVVVVFSIVLTVSAQEPELVGKQIQPRQIIKPKPVQPPCLQPPSGMVAWWPLDETSGTTANDLWGFNNQGTHVNGPTPTLGKVAGALRFDGVDDHVRVPDHAELDVGTGNFTLDAWVRTSASSGVVVLVDKRSGPTPLGYSLFLANGKLGFQMANGVGSGGCTPTPTSGVACVNYGGVVGRRWAVASCGGSRGSG